VAAAVLTSVWQQTQQKHKIHEPMIVDRDRDGRRWKVGFRKRERRSM